MKHWEEYKVDIPEGKIGDWEVKKFEVTDEGAKKYNFFSVLSFSFRRVVPGWFTKLTYKGETIMSDTRDEIRDHREPIDRGFGHCLINGLGLGMITKALLDKPEVIKVTVIEIVPEVIELVGVHLLNRYPDRLEIIQSDALTYKPQKDVYFDMVWHDIWPTICTDNYPDMKLLHRRYGRKARWQGSWGRDLIRSEGRKWGW